MKYASNMLSFHHGHQQDNRGQFGRYKDIWIWNGSVERISNIDTLSKCIQFLTLQFHMCVSMSLDCFCSVSGIQNDNLLLEIFSQQP